jgi:hypothetical protein
MLSFGWIFGASRYSVRCALYAHPSESCRVGTQDLMGLFLLGFY